MKSKILHTVVLALILNSSLLINICQSQWAKYSNGIYGGYVNYIHTNNNNILAATLNGVYISTNNGDTWKATDLQYNKNCSSIISDGTNLYAGTVNYGIYKSTNNGVNWIQTSLNNTTVNSLAIITNNIFAATNTGIYYSTNSGTNWTMRAQSGTTVKLVLNHQNVLFGVWANQIFRSTNLGLNWDFTAGGMINAVCSTNNTLFIGNDLNNGIWASSNMGANWTQCMSNESVWSFYANGLIMYAGTYSGLKVSINGGFSWNPTTLITPTIVSLNGNSSRLFAGTQGKAIYLSSNSGVNWSRTLDEENINVFCTVDSILFCGTLTSGVYSSTNDGLNWQLAGLNSEDIYSFANIGSTIFAGTGSNGGVKYTTNYGANWTQTTLTTYAYSLQYINSLLFAGTATSGIYRTSNMGTNWTQLALSDKCIKAIKYNGTTIFASAYDANINADDGVYISNNNGNSWSISGLNYEKVNDLMVYNGNIYAATDINGVYMTTNNGANWTSTTLNNRNIYKLYSQSNIIFACSLDSGIYVSTNNGNSWLLRNEGMGSQKVNTIHSKNNYLFAGTALNNVWRRPINEILTQIKLNELNEKPTAYSLTQNYPNPFNPTTKINFALPKSSEIKIVVYDISGKELEVIVNERLQAGTYETEWNGSNYSSGVYFYKIMAGDFVETRKMILIK